MTRSRIYSESAMGLQPGEAYGENEECHTHISRHRWRGRTFEVYFDEMTASPFSQWQAFCPGIGTVSGEDRQEVIDEMKSRIGRE